MTDTNKCKIVGWACRKCQDQYFHYSHVKFCPRCSGVIDELGTFFLTNRSEEM